MVKIKKIPLIKIISLYDKPSVRIFAFLRFLLLPYQKVEKYLPKSGKILDVGCGHGPYTLYFALKEPRRRLFGFDLNEKRVKEANKAAKNFNNVKFFVRDLTKDTSLKNCDCICFIDVLHHLPTTIQKRLLKESFNKLRRNGVLLIKDIDKKPRWKYMYNYIHDKIMTRNDELFFSSSNKMEQRLKNLNFDVFLKKRIKTWFLNPIPHYIILARRSQDGTK